MAREIFKLVGLITTQGVEKTADQLKGIDKQAKVVARQFGKVEKSAKKMGMAFTKFATGPIAALGGSMLFLAGKTGEYADKLLDLEQVTGLSTDSLQQLEHVSRVAGVSFEGLTGTISKFQGRLPQIVAEGGTAFETIKELGVSVFDASGRVRDMNTLFPELLGKLQGIENVTERNAMAQQLFGRSMQDLAPVLGMSADQMAEVMGQADGMGLVMSKDALEAANKYRIGMEELKASFTAVWRNVASQFIPLLTGELIPAIQEHVIPAIMRAGEVLGGLVEWFTKLPGGMKKTIVQWAALAAAIGPTLILVSKFAGMGKLLIPLFVKLVTGQLSLNAAMSANPIGFVITLIAALVAAGVALYNNWDFVKEKLVGAWEAISYATQQAVSFGKTLLLKYLETYVNVIDTVGRFIPGVNTALDMAKGKLREMIAAESESRHERKLARLEAKQQKIATEEVAAAVEQAKAATEQYTATTAKLANVRREDTKETDKQAAAERKLAEDRAAIEEEYAQKVQAQIFTKEEQLAIERENALMAAEELGASKLDIETYYLIESERLKEEAALADQKRREQEQQAEATKWAEFKSQAMSAVNQVSSLLSQSTQVRLTELDQETAREKAAIESSKMSEEGKDAAIAALEQKADQRKRELLRKQAKRDKAAAVFGAIINTAQAISKALTLGPPVGIIMAALMGVLGAVQIGMILAQPLPKLAKGGTVKGGQGGITAEIGEGSQDELVLPMETGVASIVDTLLAKLAGFVPAVGGGSGAGAPAFAGAMGGSGGPTFQIGTLIADDRGIKELERRMRQYRTSDDQRMGIDA